MLLGCSHPIGTAAKLPAAQQVGGSSFTVHLQGNTYRGRLPCLLLLWFSTLISGFRKTIPFSCFLWGDCVGTENYVL